MTSSRLPGILATRTRAGILAVLTLTVAGSMLAFSRRGPHAPVDGWDLVEDHPAGGKYEDISFPDPLNGWIINFEGFVLHTTDGGKSWAEQASGLTRVRSLDFLDAKRGFAGALTGKLYGTADGGTSWQDITATLPKSIKGICGITHLGNQLHIVGRYNLESADYFYSPDGGKSWRYQDLRPMAEGLVDIAFIDEKVGFIGGMGRTNEVNNGPALILKTTDGGLHWRQVFRDTGGRGYAWKLWPVSKTLLYAAMQSEDGIYRIAKSIDAGEHWEVQIVATGRPMGYAVQGVGFMDAEHGWVGGIFNGMFKTVNGGKTWTKVDLPDGTINRFEKVGNTMIAGSTRGVLRYTPPAK